MNRLFSNLIDINTPKFNRKVTDGLVCLYLDKGLEYIDRVIKTAMNYPDVTYLGYQICTPEEEYNEVTKNRTNKRTYDIAKSNLFLVKYLFAFRGTNGVFEPLPAKYIYLPYVEDAGIIYLKGAKMHLSPVLSNKVISPGPNSLFVRLLRYKIIFKRLYHTITIDGVREVNAVIWSEIYRKTSNVKVPATTKALSTSVHYLFGKYGFDGTFSKYLGFVPVVGYSDINTTNYPPSEWVICRSTKVQPKTSIDGFYEGSDLRIAIRNNDWSQNAKTMIVGFYYLVDHFPSRINPEMLNNPNVWKILLGHILFSGNFGENKLFADITEHYSSIDEYVDSIVREKLLESGHDISNFYDLLSMISSKFNDFVLNNESTALSMYGKNLEVLYYVLYEITSDIFKTSFKLNKPNLRGPMTMKNVIEIFNKNMRMRAIRSLTSNRVVIEAVGYGGDNKYPKLTSSVSEQESVPNSQESGKKRLTLGQDKHLDVSAIEAGSILFLSKSDPTPCKRLNPYVHIDIKTGTILPNPNFKLIRDKTAAKLKGRKYKK